MLHPDWNLTDTVANHLGEKVCVGSLSSGVGGLVPGRGTVGMQEASQPEDPVHTAACMSLAARPRSCSCLLILLPAAFLVALFGYLLICFSLPPAPPWHQAPFPDRLASCPKNMSPLVLRTCGCWAGLASEIALVSATAFSDLHCWMGTSLPFWFLCFIFCRNSSLISWWHAFI